MLLQELHANELDATMSYGINCSLLLQNSVYCSFAGARVFNFNFRQLFPYDMNAVPPCKGSSIKRHYGCYRLVSALGNYRRDWTSSYKEVKRWLDSIYRKRRGQQAVRLEVGGDQGPDCTTWIRHCSTCLLISSSLPANGALHSGHTWPPSSGFLLFIFPIRAGDGRKRERQRQRSD